MSDYLIASHLSATWFMVGLVWIIQLVQYPLWCHVGADSARQFHSQHSLRIGWVVAVLGGAEIFCAMALVIMHPGWPTAIGVVTLAAIWVVTVMVQVPQHRSLTSNWNPVVLRRLVTSNWIRTALWTVRGILAIWLMLSRPR